VEKLYDWVNIELRRGSGLTEGKREDGLVPEERKVEREL